MNKDIWIEGPHLLCDCCRSSYALFPYCCTFPRAERAVCSSSVAGRSSCGDSIAAIVCKVGETIATSPRVFRGVLKLVVMKVGQVHGSLDASCHGSTVLYTPPAHSCLKRSRPALCVPAARSHCAPHSWRDGLCSDDLGSAVPAQRR